ncbi:hypothetical protein [Bradyrhizobium sp. SZCCHNS3053]|uniref:DUF6197 family protein n=1 Tax=Bradyrhizobium sp. SZCCHNS3053 TaxID=3057322 RepID=UPI002916E774|nr:hypothetical protein [Bradyrhizobium sp. SZCCHNS3053]
MSKTSEILTVARALIADPDHWTKWSHARDNTGQGVPPLDPRAVCFCADGALMRAAGTVSGQAYMDASLEMVHACRDLTGSGDYVTVNDGSARYAGLLPHQAILASFDRAIERAKLLEA